MASITTIPPEVWISHYPHGAAQRQTRHGVAALARTCKSLQYAFNYILYSEVDFMTLRDETVDYVKQHAQQAVQLLLLLRTLRENSQHGAAIKWFYLDIEEGAMACHEHESRFADFYAALHGAFPASTLPPELRTGALLGNSIGSRLLHEKVVEGLLKYMPRVRTLVLDSQTGPLALDKDCQLLEKCSVRTEHSGAVKSLLELPSMTTFNLKTVRLHGITELAKSIDEIIKLNTLGLEIEDFADEHIEPLRTIISKCSNLKSIRLLLGRSKRENTIVHIASAQSMQFKMLRSTQSTLTHLDMKWLNVEYVLRVFRSRVGCIPSLRDWTALTHLSIQPELIVGYNTCATFPTSFAQIAEKTTAGYCLLSKLPASLQQLTLYVDPNNVSRHGGCLFLTFMAAVNAFPTMLPHFRKLVLTEGPALDPYHFVYDDITVAFATRIEPFMTTRERMLLGGLVEKMDVDLVLNLPLDGQTRPAQVVGGYY